MRKHFVLIIGLLSLVLLIGCGSVRKNLASTADEQFRLAKREYDKGKQRGIDNQFPPASAGLEYLRQADILDFVIRTRDLVLLVDFLGIFSHVSY